jgi:malate dehydrogenase
MASSNTVRIALSGAAGRVAYALLFRIANGGLFGHDQPVALSLLDLPRAVPLLQACAMELRDCAFPLLTEVRIDTDPVRAFQGADWIILLGGESLRPQPSHRLDLLRQNAPIMIDHGRAINRAAPTGRILVVASPCNTNCLIAMSHAQDVPKEHWFALNQLVRMTATGMVAEKAGVSVNQVTRLTVWGNNSEAALVDLQNARIDNRPALEVLGDPSWVQKTFEPALNARFREIVGLTGTSPGGSAAHAILTTIRTITTMTPFEHWFGAGVRSDGSYGVPKGLVFGFPLVSDGKSWSIAQGHYLDPRARERIAENVAELEHEAASVSHLLGRT